MTTVEVLAPVRLETRFVAPADRPDGSDQWQLRLRVYPDEFSIARTVPPPSPDELDRLTEAVGAMSPGPDGEASAFAAFASSVGAARALGLWRRCVVGGDVDRSGAVAPDDHIRVHAPAGLPAELQVWLVGNDGSRTLAGTLAPDLAAIAADLDLEAFQGSAELAAGSLPETWWLSYERAKTVGLGVDLDVGVNPPDLDALMVLGLGETDAAELVDTHNAGSRTAVLAPGTPTNTVHGEPTTDFGDHADTLYPLLHLDPTAQLSTRSVLKALTGRVPADALPMLGGDVEPFGAGLLAVQGFWPVLWGRALRDVITTDREIELAQWAQRQLSVEGPWPAIRVGEQPYGILPTSTFAAWVPDAGDDLASIEESILGWATRWRAGAALAAEQAGGWVDGADAERLLDVLGLHAPSRYWNVRPVSDAAEVTAQRILAGLFPLGASDWDRDTAGVWRGVPAPAFPILAAARPGQIPGPPGDLEDDGDRLKALCFLEPEPLYFRGDPPMGLVGHLFRESLIAARAILGQALESWQTAGRVDLHARLPLDDENTYRNHVMHGGDSAEIELRNTGDPDALVIADRFHDVQTALIIIAELWNDSHDELSRATLATLDAASSRPDPWLAGVAARRLLTMINEAAPFKLGAYGWVDGPAPDDVRPALAPGPTAAGLLHAPSHEQALAAALLRDPAVRHRDEGRWRLNIDSAKVRASVALAQRVRLGVHPYEALGLEVEAVTGDWDVVRLLRERYPLGPDQDLRRVCDGAAVLAAARAGGFAADLPGDLADRLAPLDDVLDTYADLLVTDGVHALVTGRADLANAAMEAAAGLGAPPDLRAIRTPRAATTVRTSAWVVLPPGEAPALSVDTAPLRVADPAFTALIEAELGAAAVEATDEATVAERHRLAAVLGGGDREAPVPSLTGGAYPGLSTTADDDLHAAMVIDLDARLALVTELTQTVHDAVVGLDPDDAATEDTLAALATRWHVDLGGIPAEDPTTERQTALAGALAERLAAAAPPPPDRSDTAVNARRDAIRALAGDPSLPVLPAVATGLLPTLNAAADLDQSWLEVVAAVRPRVAPLEARQLAAGTPWAAVLATPDGGTDAWHASGPVLAAYGPDVVGVLGQGTVAVAALDAWTDSVPSSRHVTAASFGFNSPKSRAPQAILLAVPPDRSQRLTTDGLLDVVLETRQLAHARSARPTDHGGLPYATPAPLVHAEKNVSFLEGWR